MGLLRFLLAVSAVSAAFFWNASAAEDARPRASISAHVQDGYARLLFDWDEEVEGTAQSADGVVVITFAKPFQADTSALFRTLEPYVALVRQDADGRTLRLAMKGPVRVKSTQLSVRHAIDLIPPGYKGEPPAPAAPAGHKVASQVAVKVTERERTTRLQFEFPGKVTYTARMADGKLEISFSKPGKVNLKRFAESPPSWIKAARSSSNHGKLRVEFDIDREADFRDVSTDGEIAFELREPKSDAQAIEAHTQTDAGPAQAPKVIIPQAEELVPPPPVIVADSIIFPPLPRKGAATAHDKAAEHGAADAGKPDAASASAHGSDPAHKQNSDASALHAIHAGEPAATTNHTEVLGEALPPSLRVPESDLSAALGPELMSTPPVPGRARATFFGSNVRIELPFAKLPAAAVFRRGLAIWVVLETAEGMDLAAVASLPGNPVRILSTPSVISEGVTAFRFEAPSSMAVSAAAMGDAWVISVGNTVPDLPAQLQLVRQTTGSATKLRTYMPGLTRVVWLTDPDVKDRLAAVLGFAPARGIMDGRTFVEFAALPSQQGLAVQANVDDLSVTVDGQDAVISRPQGLSVSAQQFVEALTKHGDAEPTAEHAAAVNFKAWGAMTAPTRSDTIASLILKSAQSGGGMSPARMSLSRYYIAEGFGAEALGVLRNVAHDDRTADSNPAFRVARAIANIQMARYREAIQDLAIDQLGADPHAALWRGIAAAGERDWRMARSNLMTALKIVNRYPAEWQAKARVGLAHASLGLNEAATAKFALEGIPKAGLHEDVLAHIELARAMTDVALDKKDAGLKRLDHLTQSRHLPIAARASLQSVLLKSKSGKMTVPQAIDALERLRFQWRGDDIELQTLTELGKLYVENNRVREGLNTMRLAVRHFSDTDEARQTAAQMSKIFENLFLGPQNEKFTAVQALTLFYDYKELIPVGAQGDEIIRKLAERLVSVDLLPQAAELLQHQVDQRLDGVAKASVATRLALIYLLDRQPSKALNVIRTSRQTRLPDELIGQRDLIEARALADTRNFDQALDLLSSDLSKEADRLRADIYWDSQRWSDAGAKHEAMIGNRFVDGNALTDAERSDLMRAAVAYSLAGDSPSLERLRSRYQPKMSQSPDAKAFAMITHAPDVTSEDYKTLVKRIASADTLDAFLSEMRAKYTQAASAAPTASN